MLNLHIQVKEYLNIDNYFSIVHIINLSDNKQHSSRNRFHQFFTFYFNYYIQLHHIKNLINKPHKRYNQYWSKRNFNQHNLKFKFSFWSNNHTEIYNSKREELIHFNSDNQELCNEIFNLYPELSFIEHDSFQEFIEHIQFDYTDNTNDNIDSLFIIKNNN